MKFEECFVYLAISLMIVQFPTPSEGGHVRVRLHVPKHIKTVYRTKIIKVPEHHHYIHQDKDKEKEDLKLVKIPEYHHFFHEKEEKPKYKYWSNHRYGEESSEEKYSLEEVRELLRNAGRWNRYKGLRDDYISHEDY